MNDSATIIGNLATFILIAKEEEDLIAFDENSTPFILFDEAEDYILTKAEFGYFPCPIELEHVLGAVKLATDILNGHTTV